MLTSRTIQTPTGAATAGPEPATPDHSAAAFLAEVNSEEFQQAVEARRAVGSSRESHAIAQQYRAERAERVASELRR